MTTTYHLTLKSKNGKLGGMPATTTSRDTCPTACGLYGDCYGLSGPLAWHWPKVSRGERGGALKGLTQAIRAFSADQVWRNAQAGDLPGVGNAINARDLHRLAVSAAHTRGIGFTHKPVLGGDLIARRNRAAIRAANAIGGNRGLCVNLSADTLAEADAKAALSIGPVVVVVPTDAPRRLMTPEGRRVSVCPAQLTEDKPRPLTCMDCGWCHKKDRQTIVGFRAHGVAAKRISARLALID